MPHIQILSELLVNKIAAGEVIERPASVVKEVIENSLDAGATRLDVTIEQGGRKLIRVADNGCGMDGDDLALCVRPHATSKITREEDLFSIRTMGFRGEALASIGAVSQLRVVSRPADSDEAHEVATTGNKVEPITATAAPPGTTIEVRELFFNVPARQKFLRAANTEIGHITEQLARIALVHPQIEFRLTHNGRPVHHLRSAQAMRSRIGDLYGPELADELLDISRDEHGLKITGYVGRPRDSRSSGKWQYLFLNGRYIRDRLILHAVREAYRGLMESNRYPVVFLALEIDPANVDVNVHPTKIEVRWRDSNVIYSQVLSAVRDRFLNTDLTPELQANRARSTRSDSTDSGPLWSPPDGLPSSLKSDTPEDPDAAETRRQKIRESIAEFFKRTQSVVGAPSTSSTASSAPLGGPPLSSPPLGRFHQPNRLTSSTSASATPAPTMQELRALPCGTSVQGNVIQIHRTYLVAETADGIIVIDQHALHERVLYEQLSKQFAQGPLESQRMLIPETIDVSPDQMAVIETHAETLQQLGLELSPYGPNTIAVHAAPTLLRPERMIEFVRDMLDRLAERSGPATTELLANDLLSMMACKAAVKAGDPLSPEEIRALMSQRDRVERSSNCPHGRPTSLRLTLQDLERQFKRT